MSLVLHHEGFGKSYHVTEFDSFAMVEALALPVHGSNSKDIPNLQICKNQYAMGMPEIRKMFTEGWADGADIALKMADELEAVVPQPKDLRRSLAWADSGDELEIDNLYSGRVDNLFRTRKRKYRPTQTVITIGMHLCTLWGSPERNMLSGAVGIALARVLERFGYRVELYSLLTANGYIYKNGKQFKQNYVGVVKVKEAYSSLNAAEIAAVHHPATSQTMVQAVMARGAAHDSCNCQDFASSFATKFMRKTGRRFDYCFDWISSEYYAKRELVKAVKAIGGTVFEEAGLEQMEIDQY